ncbi:hypothetical protein RUND412_007345 [Rhizina undulata]
MSTSENKAGNGLFTFDSGDMCITVTYDNEICTGTVSSHAMALASPVWKKFLFPHWSKFEENQEMEESEKKDGRKSPVQQLNFVKDDGEALLILLRIAHLKFKEVPVTLSYNHLLNLAILVDRYDCIGIVRPWLATLLANEETDCKAPEHGGWLFIAWAFGRNEVFKDLALKMVKEIVVDASGVALTSSKKPIFHPMPDGLIERILAVRLATIDKLLDIPYVRIDRYENTKNTICQQRYNQKACDALVYGSLIRGLQIAGFWPRKKPEETHVSIDQLASTLDGLEIFVMPRIHQYDYYEVGSEHNSCSVHNFKQQVSGALSDIQYPVVGLHYRHMEAQKTSKPIEIATINTTKLFTFEHGNVKIKVTHQDELVVGKVSSHCMVLASKVWQNFIFDPLMKYQTKGEGSQGRKEGATEPGSVKQPYNNQDVEKQDPTWENDEQEENSSGPVKEVNFRDDDGEALLLLLRIAHLQYDDIPTMLPYETLLSVAVLCDQYDCVKLVEPWLSQWLSAEEKSWKQAGHENWLFIAWVFGRDKVFSDLADKMVREAKTDDDGEILTSAGEEVSEPMPPGILERILQVREETINNLLELPYSRLDKYESTIASICRQPGNKEGCDAAVYGSIARGVQKAGLWPRKRAGEIHMSATELAAKVGDIQVHYPTYKSSYSYENHYSCSTHNFMELVTKTLSAIPSPVLESHRRHMEAQK